MSSPSDINGEAVGVRHLPQDEKVIVLDPLAYTARLLDAHGEALAASAVPLWLLRHSMRRARKVLGPADVVVVVDETDIEWVEIWYSDLNRYYWLNAGRGPVRLVPESFRVVAIRLALDDLASRSWLAGCIETVKGRLDVTVTREWGSAPGEDLW